MKRGVIVIHFARFGPYHLARIGAAAGILEEAGYEVAGLETAGLDQTYAWKMEREALSWRRHTVFPGEAAEAIKPARLRGGILKALDQIKPVAVVIGGWGSVDARACLAWCRKNGARAIVMSETREADGRRVWWKEVLKSGLIRRFNAALVGGKSHRDYLVKLGVPREDIHFGYNIVDNEYFASAATGWRRQETVPPYFLASNRFIVRKNLGTLLMAYAEYVRNAAGPAWGLCLMGDGELMPELRKLCTGLKLEAAGGAPWERAPASGQVFFPGFRQIGELPRFYAHAGCFVHPALEEPWGLVINEAMACGLPVLSSHNVGAAEELVDDGINGWCFDPLDTEAMAGLLARVASPDFPRGEFSAASTRIVEERAPLQAFGRGLLAALRPHPPML